MLLNRAWIAGHIPHQGRMCLLDEVLEWDAQRIRCRSATHRGADNPLRAHGRLGAACGIEYAAQAMAVHGALAAATTTLATGPAGPAGPGGPGGPGPPGRSPGGFLASLRDVTLHVERLDDIESDLVCEAQLLAGSEESALYGFAVTAAGLPLLSGRATVLFDAGGRLRPA